MGSVPVKIGRAITKRKHHEVKKKKWEERKSMEQQRMSMQLEQEQNPTSPDGTVNEPSRENSLPNGPPLERQLSRISTLSADPREPLAEEMAHEARHGFAEAGKAIIKAPMDVSLALAQGFHNAPRLYGDPTVRQPVRISGFYSGLRAGRNELMYGVYDGVTGLATQPLRGARENGVVGFMRGVGYGVGGFVLKDIAAMIGPVAYSLKGVHKEIQKRNAPEHFIRRARIAQGRLEYAKLAEAEPKGPVETPATDDADKAASKSAGTPASAAAPLVVSTDAAPGDALASASASAPAAAAPTTPSAELRAASSTDKPELSANRPHTHTHPTNNPDRVETASTTTTVATTNGPATDKVSTQPSYPTDLAGIQARIEASWKTYQSLLNVKAAAESKGFRSRIYARCVTREMVANGAFEDIETFEKAVRAHLDGLSIEEYLASTKQEQLHACKPRKLVVEDIEATKEGIPPASGVILENGRVVSSSQPKTSMSGETVVEGERGGGKVSDATRPKGLGEKGLEEMGLSSSAQQRIDAAALATGRVG